MRDCTSPNSDCMTIASKREGWCSTPKKAIVSTIKKEEEITCHAQVPSNQLEQYFF
jgi:hypothetical protein